ncbi:hypothetical protein [Paraburkholderia tropica]|nr:hypothetical protein [Paraburkholderia tropica]
MSDDAYRLGLMLRAMARTDAELFGNRSRYEAVALRCAARLIAGNSI